MSANEVEVTQVSCHWYQLQAIIKKWISESEWMEAELLDAENKWDIAEAKLATATGVIQNLESKVMLLESLVCDADGRISRDSINWLSVEDPQNEWII